MRKQSMNKTYKKFSCEKAERFANNLGGLRAEGLFCFVLILIPYTAVAGWHPQARVKYETVSVDQKEC